MIIALAGLAGSGKDTVANILVRRFGYEKRAFADPMRKWAEELNPIVDFETGYDIPHGCVYDGSGYWEKAYRYNEIIEEEGYEKAKQYYPEIRQTLIKIGAAGRRLYGKDFWIKQALDKVHPNSRVVFSDLRMPEEADAIWNLDGHVALVNRGIEIKDPNNLDETEQFALSLTPDGIIMNTGSLVQLELHVVETFEFIEMEHETA